MLIVYRKLDKKILLNTGKSFVEPQGMSDENGKLAVIERIGGTFEDYGVFRLHDIENKEKVDEILQYKNYVSLKFNENDECVGYEIDYVGYNEDLKLDQLRLSSEEIRQAEFELKTLTLLSEVELI